MLAADVAQRVAKLVRLLGSNQPDEVIAASAALRRTLSSDGKDLHDLANLIVANQAEPAAADDWLATARWCHERSDRLNARERRFVRDMVDRVCNPSEKQLKWLAAIQARLRRSQR